MATLRILSALECSYLVNDSDNSSRMANQYVLEGVGTFSAIEWKTAIETVVEANPSVSARLKGKWFWRYWDDLGEYPVLNIYPSDWSAESQIGADFDGQLLDCKAGRCAEIRLLTGVFPKVIFRTHHALMDGNATLFWIQEVFRALRGEKPLGSECDLNEQDIVMQHSVTNRNSFAPPWAAIFPALEKPYGLKNENPDCIWQSVLLKNDIERALPKMIAFLDNRARQLFGNKIKTVFRVPSNLRRLLPEDASYQLGNLVGAIDFELSEKTGEKTIYKKLLHAMQRKQDLSVFPKYLWLVKILPRFLIRSGAERYKHLYQQGHADITATVTHVGKVSLASISCEHFKATNIYALPVPLPGVSISCVFLSHENGLSLSMSAPSALTDHQGLKQLATEFRDRCANDVMG